LIDAAAAAARRDGEKAGRAAADAAIEAAKKAAEEEADRANQIAAGNFETVQKDLESKLAKVTADRDAFKKRYEDAVAQVSPGVDAKWKDLPAEVAKLYRGADDDPIAKAAFLAESEPLLTALAGKAGTGSTATIWPRTPKPNGDLTPEQAAKAEADRLRATGKYAI
jgi:hypothetical protein